ncbi:MAG TPA: STAS domain-containing protein [Chthoniobacterales bacterium]|jgi:anti-sigma B factor antagonist|nr:STAS domain-containing protein [Chthoniobacterales bacterium]
MASSGSANVLPLEGEIDLHVSPRVERSLASIIAKRPQHVVVDLSGVTFIDSSGLAVLIHAMQDVNEYGGKLTLSGINENVRVIFEMARLDQFFLIEPRDDELLAAD